MNSARLSPDGHAVAFASPVSGINQIFLMLTSGGEPLQLTNDEGDKIVDNFSHDGKEVYYVKVFLAWTRFGLYLHSEAPQVVWRNAWLCGPVARWLIHLLCKVEQHRNF